MHSILRPEDDLISNCGPNVKKTVSFGDVVHFTDDVNIVTYVDFDCGIPFLPETPTKIRQINRERNYISRSCEKPQCIASNNQHFCPVDEQHSSNIFRTPYILRIMSPAALTLCPISTLNQQLTNLEQTHIRCSFHCERSTVKGRDCASALHSFQELFFSDGRVNETVATVEELSDLWKPGAMDGVPPFMVKCNCI